MAATLTQSTTLIVDDFQGMRTMLRDFVKSMGITRIDTAANGKEAMSLLAGKNYDIVICDYNLGPGQNGQQVMEEAKLRKHISYSTIWVIVTAEKTMDMVMGAAETKPDDYLLKPINAAMLESRLTKLIAKKQSLDEIEKAVRAQDYVAAIAHCDAQLRTQPANAQELLRIKGELLLTIGDFDGARGLFEKILQLRNIPWAKTGLGKVHFFAKEYLRAREIFEQVLAENKFYLEAADLLAKTHDALGDNLKSQEVLSSAMALSPNSLQRQQNLAEAAYRNGDLDTSHAAYEKAIKLSTNSVHKNPAIYAGLAKVLTDQDVPGEAIKVLSEARKEFKDDPEASLHAAIVESAALQKMGEPEQARQALAEADKLLGRLGGTARADIAMDMAKSLLQLGEKERACGLLANLVRNNHENTEVIAQVEAFIEDGDIGEEAENLVKRSKQDVIDINNKGVLLAREGKFGEGVKLLRKAIETLPNNETILMNLCGMLIRLMAEEGKNDRMIHESRSILEHVRDLNPANQKYHEYVCALSKLAGNAN